MTRIEPQVAPESKPVVASRGVLHPSEFQPMVKLSEFDIGATLSVLIDRSGKTKLALAAYLGVSEQAVQKWVKKGTLAREHVRGICQFLECSADELFGLAPIGEHPAGHSQSVRLDPEILAATIKGLRLRDKRANRVYSLADIEEDPARFIEAYELFMGMVPKPVPDNAIPHSPQGAKQNGRSDDMPVSGATGRKMGKVGGRKS